MGRLRVLLVAMWLVVIAGPVAVIAWQAPPNSEKKGRPKSKRFASRVRQFSNSPSQEKGATSKIRTYGPCQPADQRVARDSAKRGRRSLMRRDFASPC